MGMYIRIKKFANLKSHDYHVLMQQFWPLTLCGLLAIKLWMVVMKFKIIIRQICNKVWNLAKIDSLWVNVEVNIASFEMHFPPSFFNIMIELMYHLVDELDLCGPVAIRWMYLMGCYMKTLKTYVHNMARLEGSMDEGYIWDECLMEYLQRFEVVQWCIWGVGEEKRNVGKVLEGVGKKFMMILALCDLTHQYVLTNITLMSLSLK